MNNTKYEVVKFIDNNIELDVTVSPDEDTVWLNQEQMASLFEVDRTRITRHINNIFSDGELDFNSNVRKTHFTNKYKPVMFYSLNVIISVGYRIKSQRGVKFRIWASTILKQYLLKGYVINENRTLVTNDNYVRLINKVESIDERLINVEYKLNKKELPIEKYFMMEKHMMPIHFFNNYLNKLIMK